MSDITPVHMQTVKTDDDHITKVIVTNADTGEHILDFLWDERDEQTPEKQKEFHEWVKHILQSKGLIE
jgi:hypothetical protein